MFDYFAIDWGSKKCGIALGSSTTQLVTPKSIVPTLGLFGFITNLLNEKPTLIRCVIGENKTFDGKPTTLSESANKLKKDLTLTYPNLEVVLYNERGTTGDYDNYSDDLAAAKLLELYFRFEL